ncbi:MAG TPA: phosphotransferase family protein [Steroidobacteraceae bacterium]|nr:phosphotransferase family protein [Steroidobacteraceae bacterium]
MPSSLRLLQALRASLGAIGAQNPDLKESTRLTLRVADAILGELALRQNGQRVADAFSQLRDIALEGITYLEGAEDSGALELSDLPSRLPDTMAYDEAGLAVEAVLHIVQRQIASLRQDRRPEVRRFMARAIEAEDPLFRQAEAPASRVPARELFTAERFESYLARMFPERRFRVAGFRELLEGYQKTTILSDLLDGEGNAQSVVIRADKSEVFLRFDAGKVAEEYRIVRLLFERGIPVAEPLWLEENPEAMGRAFMVSRRLPGMNPGNPLAPRRISEQEARAIVQTLARIHGTGLDRDFKASPIGHWLDHGCLRDNTIAAVESWRAQPWMQQVNASVATTRLVNWLLDNVPAENGPARLLHVDYGPHNLLIDAGQVSGVLDWESARIGDPAEDLSDLLSRFQGRIPREQALRWYAEAGGDAISEQRLRYFDAFNNIKTLIGPLSAAALFENEPQSELKWCLLPLLYGSVNRAVEEKIEAAESAAGFATQQA